MKNRPFPYLFVPRLIALITLGFCSQLSAGLLPSSQPYQESGGIVIGEAENYHAIDARAGVTWVFVESGQGAFINNQGTGYMTNSPDGSHNVVGYLGSASIDYQIVIQTTGTYRLWLRWEGRDSASDSIYAGIVELADGNGGAADWYEDSGNQSGDFDNSDWDGNGEFEANAANAAQNPMLWSIQTPGTYTLRISGREDGLALDAWALQLNSLPEPGQSPPIAIEDSLVMHVGKKAAVPVLRNDLNLDLFDRIEILNAPGFSTAEVQGNTILVDHSSSQGSSDSLTYQIVDSLNQASNPATLSITYSNEVRIENTTLNLPLSPPAESVELENAFGSLTFNQPLNISNAPGETDRIFICEKGGRIQLVKNSNTSSPTKVQFLDLVNTVGDRSNEAMDRSSESGLLGLAFHPAYADNGHFYVFYSVFIQGLRYQRVSRFTVSANPDAADPASEVVLIEQLDESVNHNGGDLHFGPDGYLYIAVGDEGGSNDSLNNSQRIDKDYFSGILRIDVDKLPGNLEPNPHPSVKRYAGNLAAYSVPNDNPWVNATSFNGVSVNPNDVITEFYAVGMRNPWRIHFDAQTGQLYCADVGQGSREEVSIIQAGGNYGWAYFEGTRPGPKTPPNGFTHTEPIYEYARGSGPLEGTSISGGVVYYGANFPNLRGKYIFGDYGSGNIWSLDQDGADVTVERLAGASGPVSFGIDPANGDVLVASINIGQIQRLVAGGVQGGYPVRLSETGIFADLTDLSPNPGILAYAPNLSFWSDHAIKDRWFVVPNLSDAIEYQQESPWSYPVGMVWVKHFEMEMERGVPSSRKRLETRIFVRNEQGAYGVSYRWNEEETDAFLVANSGESFLLEIQENGQPIMQEWRIPGRAECITCHLPSAGHALSFNTRQLNRNYPLGGFHGNQLDTLRDAGYLTNAPVETATLPRHVRPDETQYSLEARARSYLAVNCAYCHQDSVANPGSWDARAALKLAETQMVNGTLSNDGGDSNRRVIVPGSPQHSVLLSRVGATEGFSRMPPLASTIIDEVGLNLLRDWIENELPDSYLSYDEWRLQEFGSEVSPEGARNQNPDGDSSSNELEWLARTDPNDAQEDWKLAFFPFGASPAELQFLRVRNRFVQVEVSSDLIEWRPLDHPDNAGIPEATDVMELFTLETDESVMFYRLRIEQP